MALLLYLFFSIALLMLLVSISRRRVKKHHAPPSPFKLPVLGNLHQLGSLPHRSLQALSLKHGPLMLLHLGKFPTIVVSSAEIAHDILKTNDIVFANRPFSYAAQHLFYGSNDMAYAPYGDYWRQVRKICSMELLSSRRVQSFKPVREEVVESMIKEISNSCSSMAVINLSEMFQSMSGNIISRVALGKTYKGEELGKNGIGHLAKELEQLLGYFYVADYFPLLEWIDVLTGKTSRLKSNFKGWDDFLDQVIEDNLRMTNDQDQHTNFVSVLLQVQKDCATDTQLTKENIKAIIMDMMSGGTDTIAAALEWAMGELIKNPGAMEKAKGEVRRVVGGRSKVDEDDISRMEYLQAVVKETLRLHPSVPLLVPRESSASTTLQGYHLPPNTRAIINAWAIARDPKSWGNAEEFLPERFINCPTDYKGQDFQFIPFGAGRRGCPGMLFAIPTTELALANLLYWFDWKMPGNKTKDDLDLTEELGVVVHMKTPLRLVPAYHSA